jgi:prolipoprotein diacylglyceryltransferase
LSLGLLAADAILQISAYLTGSVVGLSSDLPWALPYFDDMRHPAALYRAAGDLLLAGALFVKGDIARPGRLVLLAGLGYALVRLLADAFVADAPLIGSFRISQVVAFFAALAMSLLLAWTNADDNRVFKPR